MSTSWMLRRRPCLSTTLRGASLAGCTPSLESADASLAGCTPSMEQVDASLAGCTHGMDESANWGGCTLSMERVDASLAACTPIVVHKDASLAGCSPSMVQKDASLAGCTLGLKPVDASLAGCTHLSLGKWMPAWHGVQLAGAGPAYVACCKTNLWPLTRDLERELYSFRRCHVEGSAPSRVMQQYFCRGQNVTADSTLFSFKSSREFRVSF
jgi:hypothetical protein